MRPFIFFLRSPERPWGRPRCAISFCSAAWSEGWTEGGSTWTPARPSCCPRCFSRPSPTSATGGTVWMVSRRPFAIFSDTTGRNRMSSSGLWENRGVDTISWDSTSCWSLCWPPAWNHPENPLSRDFHPGRDLIIGSPGSSIGRPVPPHCQLKIDHFALYLPNADHCQTFPRLCLASSVTRWRSWLLIVPKTVPFPAPASILCA